MNASQVMVELEKLGTEQARKTYRRHGVTGAAFGVRYADLYRLQKAIGRNAEVARELWETGNHDARILALLIAHPGEVTAATLSAWAKTVNNQLAVDALARLAANSPHARDLHRKWIRAREEWVAATGWHVLAVLCSQPDAGGYTEDELIAFLDVISHDLSKSDNRVRYSMNNALIAIGVRGRTLLLKAEEAARRIGKVVVDHGDTSCNTPDAIPYMKKVLSHRAKLAARRATGTRAPRKGARAASPGGRRKSAGR